MSSTSFIVPAMCRFFLYFLIGGIIKDSRGINREFGGINSNFRGIVDEIGGIIFKFFEKRAKYGGSHFEQNKSIKI